MAMQSNPHLSNVLFEIDEVIEQAIHEEVFPGATLWINYHGEVIKNSAYGKTSDRSYSTYALEPVTTKTIYDLASLTKIIATTGAIMHLSEKGLLRLTDSVSTYLPLFGSNQQKASVTIWHLLTHTSGLPASPQLYRKYHSKRDLIERICYQNLLFLPGEQQLYCDLGFILLGEIVCLVSNCELGEYTRSNLFDPLGMNDTMFNPPETFKRRVAPTEFVEWRGGLIHGEVHDENAWAMGGEAGHAGLFSTTEDLAKFCSMILSQGEYGGKHILETSSVTEMLKSQNPASHEPFGLGLMINRPLFMGELASNETFGHTGFTGTSMIISREHDLFVILLSNRVCPRRSGPDINPSRQRIANALSKLYKISTSTE